MKFILLYKGNKNPMSGRPRKVKSVAKRRNFLANPKIKAWRDAVKQFRLQSKGTFSLLPKKGTAGYRKIKALQLTLLRQRGIV